MSCSESKTADHIRMNLLNKMFTKMKEHFLAFAALNMVIYGKEGELY